MDASLISGLGSFGDVTIMETMCAFSFWGISAGDVFCKTLIRKNGCLWFPIGTLLSFAHPKVGSP